MSPHANPFIVSPSVDRETWTVIAKSDPDATVLQSPGYRDAVLASGGYHDISRLYSFPSGNRVIVPLTRRRMQPAMLARAASWSTPWGAGGPICEDGRLAADEAAAILSNLSRLNTNAVQLVLPYRANGVWTAQAGKFAVTAAPCHVLDLRGGFDVVWRDRFRSSARRAVRKAENSAVEVEVGRSRKLIDEFYGLYQASMDRWASAWRLPAWAVRRYFTRQQLSPAMLALVADNLGEDCRIWMARRHGQPVAAIVTLAYGDSVRYWRGAMDKELASPVRANNLLHRLAVEDACRAGYRAYEMGYSPSGSPLARFKESFGAGLHFTHDLRLERIPVMAAEHGTLSLAKSVIKLAHRSARGDQQPQR